jgi:hypothetical protein
MGESSTNTDAIRIRAVSRANQDFARRMLWSFYRLDNQTTVGTATNDYTIGSSTYPMRSKGLSEVFVGTTGDTDITQESQRYNIVDFLSFKKLYNQDNTYRLVYEWYDKANDLWKMHINPSPKATETITYTYFWEPPTLTATTDEITCPNIRIIALLALADIYSGSDERDLSIESKNEAEMLIAECVSRENTPAKNQQYAMGAVENVTINRGYGTY